MQKVLNGAERLQRSNTLLNNILNTADIAAELLNFGYTPDRLKSGLSLVAEVTELNNKQQAEYADQYQASETFEKAFNKSYKAYIRDIKIARIAFNENTDARIALMLDGTRKQVYSGWLKQANAFYTNLLNSKELLATIAVFSIKADQLEAEFKDMKELADLSSSHQKEKGEAVNATKVRDEKMMELDKFISELTRICKIAFDDSPENLKLIGINR